MRINNGGKFIVAIVVAQLAGIVGALFTTPSIASWYAELERPALSPPNWVFGPVWTTLFLLMGVAAFLVWRRGLGRRDVRLALGVFLLQLVLNTFWSVLFFGLHMPGAALIEIVVLWVAICATIGMFLRVSRPAAYLLSPYIVWVSFAAYLNYAIWTLNG
ncbi:MAG: TspO/MBR family protein [Candidatus Uhrbacteria bacterium]